jgi:phosphopantothenoylcysteine decarboxylase/phosphopantothenate--cysteine ligase
MASAPGNTDRPRKVDLTGYEVLVAVCGGIAAYKVGYVVSALVQRGAGVTVAMTESAMQFVGPVTFQSLTARQVFTSLWSADAYYDPQHIRLTEAADLFLIAPATANIIGKIACGIADDLVSTLVMTADCPVVLAPAMNTRMWQNPIVQANVMKLRGTGYPIIEPVSGWLACRTVGPGRMAEPETILAEAIERLRAKPPKSKSAKART